MAHKKLVRRMAAWLKNTKHATVVMSELVTANSEHPDVIGWLYGAGSMLIECKVSRSDFLADAKKFFRQHEEQGMGDWRYIAVPKGLISPDEVPEGWGLLEVGAYGTRSLVKETKKPVGKPADKRRECVMLISALRRLEISTAVYVVHEELPYSDVEDSDSR